MCDDQWSSDWMIWDHIDTETIDWAKVMSTNPVIYKYFVITKYFAIWQTKLFQVCSNTFATVLETKILKLNSHCNWKFRRIEMWRNFVKKFDPYVSKQSLRMCKIFKSWKFNPQNGISRNFYIHLYRNKRWTARWEAVRLGLSEAISRMVTLPMFHNALRAHSESEFLIVKIEL